MIERMKVLFGDEEGATMVEYALLVGLIAVGLILSATTFRDKIANLFTRAGNELDKAPGS